MFIYSESFMIYGAMKILKLTILSMFPNTEYITGVIFCYKIYLFELVVGILLEASTSKGYRKREQNRRKAFLKLK